MPLPPDADDPRIRARCRAGHELGNALPDEFQLLDATGDGGELQPLPPAVFRGVGDLEAVAQTRLAEAAEAAAVRLFVYSQGRRHHLVAICTRGAGEPLALQLVNGAGRAHDVAAADESLDAFWLDSRRRFAQQVIAERPADALAASREAWQADPADVRGGMEHAELLAGAGEWPEAITVWQELHNRHPHFAPPLLRLAEAMLQLGVVHDDQSALRVADALSELARRRFATDAAAQAIRGRFLWATSRPGEASDCFRAALAIDGQHAAAHYHLGLIAAARADHATAVAAFRACLAVDPDDDDARRHLAAAEAALARS